MPGGAWATEVPLGWTAVGAVTALKATVILLVAMGAARVLRSRSAALRHLVWTTALAACLALPVLDAGLPEGLRVPAVEVPAGWLGPGAAAGAGSPIAGGPIAADAAGARGGLDGPAGGDDGAGTPPGGEPAASKAGERTPRSAGPRPGPGGDRYGAGRSGREGAGGATGAAASGARRSTSPGAPSDGGVAPGETGAAAGPAVAPGWQVAAGWIVVLVWTAGAGFVLLRILWGALGLRRVRRRADELADPEWRRRARTISRRMGGPERPPIRVSPEVSAPLTCGLLRPVLVLPQEALDEWSAERTEAVLVHELGHVVRRDVATHVLGRLACAFYWFHPLVWRAADRAATSREQACDDAVLRAGATASAYARHLVEIARGAEPRTLPSEAAVSVARRRDLEGRVLSVLEREADRRPASGGWAAVAALPALALTLALAILSVGVGPTSGPGDRTAKTVAGDGPAASAPAERSAARSDAVGAARSGGTSVVTSLIELLGDPKPYVRTAAAEALGEMRSERAVPRLAAALDDPSPEVRREAAGALGEIEDPSAVEALRRSLVTDDDRHVRKAAAWALGETESPEAVEALDGALSSVENRWIRKRVARALGETRQPSAVPVLRRLLEQRDRKIRGAALEGLVENGTDAAMEALDDALQSRDPELRAMAARALGRRS